MYKIIIPNLHTTFYNFMHFLIWLLALTLRVFENRMLRKICRPKKDEVTRECRQLHNEELCDLFCSPNVFRVVRSRRMG
jgi:hypothetical protein